MKRFLALLTALVLFAACAGAESTAAETAAPAAADTVLNPGKLESKTVSWYVGDKANLVSDDHAMTLWFSPNAPDLPYIDLTDWASIATYVATNMGTKPGYELKVTTDDAAKTVTVTRENGYDAVFNFADETVSFLDYVAFVSSPHIAYLDVAGVENEPGEDPTLLKVVNHRSRYGNYTVLNLADYDIPMIVQDGKYILPLQTLSALFFAGVGAPFFYNGVNVFVSAGGEMHNPLTALQQNIASIATPELEAAMEAYQGSEDEKLAFLLDQVSKLSEEGAAIVDNFRKALANTLYPVYASVPAAKRSEDMIIYGYNELCFELDNFYGLKEAHSITNFNTFFQQTGLVKGLMDPDPAVADAAIAELTRYWFDDMHSGFNAASCYTEETPDATFGYSTLTSSHWEESAKAARKLYPDASKPYFECGDTAYVTFDGFDIAETEDGSEFPDYYALQKADKLPMDTMGLIIHAHQQITRENSPIKNVVMDLSCNSGGIATVAAFTLCWFLGDAQVSQHHTFTDAQSTITYRADVNLDHEFDEKDTLAGRGLKLYCLISPTSFSCGNLVPWGFKENGDVTLLGKTSGGGSCVVLHMSTAWGTYYQISGPKRLAFVKNGSYYDVDRGVEPDHIIDSYEHFYDREALTKYINSLY